MTGTITVTTQNVSAPRPRRTSGWALEVILVASCALFVRLGPGTSLGVAVGALALGVVIAAIRVRSVGARQIISAASMVAVLIAVPINRLPSSGTQLLTLCAAILVMGLAGAVATGRRYPRGTLLVLLFLVITAFVTVLSPDNNAMLRYFPLVVSSLPIYIIAGQSSGRVRHRLSRFIVILAGLESVLSLVEPWVFPAHLWAPAQIGSLGQVVPLYNPLLHDSVERSQGTMGHPLALSFLLLVGIALLVRAFPTLRMLPRLLCIGLLLAGLVMSGSRNSLIITGIVLLFFLGGRVTFIRAVVSSLIAAFALAFAIAQNWLSAAAQAEFADSGSYTHRLGAYDAIGRLLSDQNIAQVLAGNGYASTSRLFTLGLLQTDGFNVVDNQFILTIGQSGILCVLILLLLCVGAFLLCAPTARPTVVAIIGTMLIFDIFSWPGVTVLTFGVLGVALNAHHRAFTNNSRDMARADQ